MSVPDHAAYSLRATAIREFVRKREDYREAVLGLNDASQGTYGGRRRRVEVTARELADFVAGPVFEEPDDYREAIQAFLVARRRLVGFIDPADPERRSIERMTAPGASA